MIEDLFKESATEVFTKAGLTEAEAPELFEETVIILAQKMSALSATMGMSIARVEAYREQKDSLVNDLLAIKTGGLIR